MPAIAMAASRSVATITELTSRVRLIGVGAFVLMFGSCFGSIEFSSAGFRVSAGIRPDKRDFAPKPDRTPQSDLQISHESGVRGSIHFPDLLEHTGKVSAWTQVNIHRVKSHRAPRRDSRRLLISSSSFRQAATCSGVAAVQTRTVPSRLAVAIRRPSGEKRASSIP
jgi:hypothetical protein